MRDINVNKHSTSQIMVHVDKLPLSLCRFVSPELQTRHGKQLEPNGYVPVLTQYIDVLANRNVHYHRPSMDPFSQHVTAMADFSGPHSIRIGVIVYDESFCFRTCLITE